MTPASQVVEHTQPKTHRRSFVGDGPAAGNCRENVEHRYGERRGDFDGQKQIYLFEALGALGGSPRPRKSLAWGPKKINIKHPRNIQHGNHPSKPPESSRSTSLSALKSTGVAKGKRLPRLQVRARRAGHLRRCHFSGASCSGLGLQSFCQTSSMLGPIKSPDKV
jgi:hypothetical protein